MAIKAVARGMVHNYGENYGAKGCGCGHRGKVQSAILASFLIKNKLIYSTAAWPAYVTLNGR